MLVPLDLYVLVQKVGRLTPELVLGWRIGGYLRETFDGLDGVRLAAAGDDDLRFGLSAMRTESRFPLDVTATAVNALWDACAWHPATGTLVEFAFAPEQAGIDAEGAASRADAQRGDVFGRAAQAAALDRQVERLMTAPLETICRIRERLVRRRPVTPDTDPSPIRCRRCGSATSRLDLWHADGVPVCRSCAGIPDAWALDQ